MSEDVYIARRNGISVKADDSEISIYCFKRTEKLPDFILDYINLVRHIILRSSFILRINKYQSKFTYLDRYIIYLDKGQFALKKMDNSDLESKTYHMLTKEEINELIDEIYKIQSSMVSVFKYTEDGYEMWSLPDRIKIYKY